uniref:Uncharacterized protein n=1 Tax=Daphnia galeata TaxID=27404 RepID=A0A8J2RLX7_9CRUS|nr:unnamed protein product [Daphnia galeata]
MDDLLAGSDSAEEAVKTIQRVQRAFKGASESLEESKGTPTDSNVVHPIGYEENSKILGVIWQPANEDHWKFNASKIAELVGEVPVRATKRQMLSLSSRLFDPLGLISPVSLLLKIQFQRLWESVVGWDEPIPEDIHQEWSSVVNGLSDLARIQIPRWYFCESNSSPKIEIHAFCDASKKAYGAIIYLRSIIDGPIHTNLVTSKTRVSPTKKITLPRLELLGALLASRLMKYVLKALITIPESVQHFWSDSTVTLGWIRGNINRWKPFVRNRVEEIRAYSQPDQWHYCLGGENPADDALPFRSLRSPSCWFSANIVHFIVF